MPAAIMLQMVRLRRRLSIAGAIVLVTAIGLVVTPFDGPGAEERHRFEGDPSSPVLWSAGMEDGSTSEWLAGGGGQLYNSGAFEAEASTDIARTGLHSLRARIWTPSSPSSGVRAFRWQEARANQELYYSAWLYLPTAYTLSNERRNGGYWNVFQFKSRTADRSRDDPVWAFYATPDGEGGLYLRAGWGWGGTALAGPYGTDGVGGKNYEPETRVSLPVGRWVHLQAFLRQSSEFDGRLTFWQDGVKLFDLDGIRTSYPNCSFNAWCADNGWSVNLYSDGLLPNPATIYIDDATISTTYVS
jgi:hypothetical protein